MSRFIVVCDGYEYMVVDTIAKAVVGKFQRLYNAETFAAFMAERSAE